MELHHLSWQLTSRLHPMAPYSESCPGVRFVLDGTVVTLSDFDPNRTVLQYLREDLHRCGTKEGCAEGDCGACTVVVAQPRNGRIRWYARNACIQLLGTLSGCALFTVESLGTSKDLHPVQQAMVECHASQCGFCTPGFVMSLFALFKTEVAFDRKTINDTLAGNLCRCTGYVSIITAARRMTELGTANAWLRRPGQTKQPGADERRLVARLESLQEAGGVAIEACGRRYFAPQTTAELAQLYRQYPDACLLAGGTDVGLWITKQRWRSDTLIYTGDVLDLQRIEITATDVVIGAAVCLSDAMPVLVDEFPPLEELLRRFASPPIRNVATLVGNIANGSPIGDSMPGLIALGANVVLRRGARRRTLALEDFYLGYRHNALRPSEFIESVTIPRLTDSQTLEVNFCVTKVTRRFDQDIATVCGAMRIARDEGRVVDARIAFGGLAEVPKRAVHCEQALKNHRFDRAAVTAAMTVLAADFTPITDMRADKHYRLRVSQNLLYRWWREIETPTVLTRVYSYADHRLAG